MVKVDYRSLGLLINQILTYLYNLSFSYRFLTYLLSFTGVKCEVNMDDCSYQLCLNAGTCTDDVSGFSCLCQSGFSGDTCEIDEDECLSSPCLNGAKCIDEPGAFR